MTNLLVPDAVISRQYERPVCDGSLGGLDQYACLPFSFTTSPLYTIVLNGFGQTNQFFTIEMTFVKAHGASYNTAFSIPVNYTLMMKQGDSNSDDNIILDNTEHSIVISCNEIQSQFCESKILLYEPQIKQSTYLIMINFTNADSIADKIDDIQMLIIYINSQYTLFLIILRYVCLAISILTLILYLFSIRPLKGKSRIFEQKYIKLLGILLIFFNDPFYALTVLIPNMASAFFSALFVITFISALLLFWICSFERINRENHSKKTKVISKAKIVFIFAFWLFLLITYSILNFNYLKDPGFDFDDEHQKTYLAFKLIMIILLIIGLGWMLNNCLFIFKNLSTRLWRHKMLFSFSLYFIIAFFILLFTGSLTIYSQNGYRVLLVYGIINIYVWFLEYLYAPSSIGIQEERELEAIENKRPSHAYEALDESNHEIEVHFDDQNDIGDGFEAHYNQNEDNVISNAIKAKRDASNNHIQNDNFGVSNAVRAEREAMYYREPNKSYEKKMNFNADGDGDHKEEGRSNRDASGINLDLGNYSGVNKKDDESATAEIRLDTN